MTDLSQLSDAELTALYNQGQTPDVGSMVAAAAQRHGVDPALAMRVARQESGLRTNAVSPKGARGPMQLMPATARELGVDPNDPEQNIDGGVRYLKQQLDRFGSPDLALAAYNAGPGAVQKYGGVPPYAETQNYVQAIQGGAGGDDLSAMSDEELQALYAQSAPEAPTGPEGRVVSQSGGVTVELGGPEGIQEGWTEYKPGADLRRDQALGFQKGVLKPLDNAARGLEWAADTVGLDEPINALGRALGLPSNDQVAADRQAALAEARGRGVAPGRIGEFVGNVVGTLPLGALRGGALAQGALGGAALSDADDAQGLLRDVAVGAVAGKAADKALGAVSKGASSLLGKAPKVMDLPQLQAAKKAAYDAVDASGFAFPKADIAAMVDDFSKVVSSSALSKSAKDDARSIITYARTLSKGDLSLSQLEKLRGDIYGAMVSKGGDTAAVGQAFRAKIDSLIDAVDNGLVRNARDLNTRYKKADLVSRASKSADIRAEKDYGGDYGRKLKDRLFPLVDPANPKRNLRGSTADEMAAIEKIVRGTKVQNAASTVGGMLDPRRMGGKILSGMTTTGGGVGAPATGGLSLLVPAAQMAAGLGLTGVASRTARVNLDDLLKLIAAGGSKQALKKSPTAASRATQKAAATVRPVGGLIGASAAAQTRGGR